MKILEKEDGFKLKKNAGLKHAEKSLSKKDRAVRISAVALALLMLAVTLGQLGVFASSEKNHWAAQYVEEAKDRAWMLGYPDGSFRPDANMTRGEFSVMLCRALNLAQATASNPFGDIEQGDWYYQAILKLYAAGIAEGCENGEFQPNDFLTREMAFTMLTRAFRLTAKDKNAYQSFRDDQEVSSWAASSVSALVEGGYVAGIGNNTLAPQRLLRRGEMAALLISIYDGEHKGGTTPSPGTGSGNGSDPGTPPDETKHAYLLMDENKLSELRDRCKNLSPYTTWYQRIKWSADQSLNAELCKYEDNDPSRLLCADTYCDRLITLAFVYCIEGDEVYADRAWAEIENAAKFPDWNPVNDSTNFAAMLKGTGLAYNWMYDYFNAPGREEKKDTLIKALVDLGLKEAKRAYDGEVNWGYQLNWVTTDNNHNIVTNTGVAIAALSLSNEKDAELTKLCKELLADSLNSIEVFIKGFAPDGAWSEGTGYWTFATKHLAEYASAFETATGTKTVNLNRFGLENTAYFYIAMTGVTKAFNLNDEYESPTNAPQMFYLANYFDDPAVGAYRLRQLAANGAGWPTVYDLLWYEPDNVSSSLDLKTDFYFRDAEVATFRNSYFETNSVYAGLHGGKNGISHGQIDAGQFVYDALGERWAIDLGRDNYNLYKYFNNFNNIPYCRWAYYRNRGEGHNTITLNTDRLSLSAPADQPIDVTAEIKTFQANGEKGMAVVDMQPIYGSYTSNAQRGMRLDKQSGALMVQDELQFRDGSGNNLYWFMHTKAQIDLMQDKKSAILSQNGKRVWIEILDGTNTFEVMDAKPLATSPNPNEWAENKNDPNAGKQDPNDGVKKLSIHNDNAGGTYVICVYMVPLRDGQNRPDTVPAVSDIALWP